MSFTGSRDANVVVADNRITMGFIMYLNVDVTYLSTTQSLGLSLEVDSDIIWIGKHDFTIDPIGTTTLVKNVLIT